MSFSGDCSSEVAVMKRSSLLLPLGVLVLLWGALAGYVSATFRQLPERIATHFGGGGQPNGWMSASGYLTFIAAMSIGVPLFLVIVFSVIRRCNGAGCNIPNRTYWLAPERRDETLVFIQRQGYWLAGLLIAFFGGIHHLILTANARSPIALPFAELGWVVGLFLLGEGAWVTRLFVRFLRKTQ
jgi:serine/threonine-protein kinase